MLTLSIKKQWFDMIASGVKKEEYRDIKPYYTSRFMNIGLLDKAAHRQDRELAEQRRAAEARQRVEEAEQTAREASERDRETSQHFGR